MCRPRRWRREWAVSLLKCVKLYIYTNARDHFERNKSTSSLKMFPFSFKCFYIFLLHRQQRQPQNRIWTNDFLFCKRNRLWFETKYTVYIALKEFSYKVNRNEEKNTRINHSIRQPKQKAQLSQKHFFLTFFVFILTEWMYLIRDQKKNTTNINTKQYKAHKYTKCYTNWSLTFDDFLFFSSFYFFINV